MKRKQKAESRTTGGRTLLLSAFCFLVFSIAANGQTFKIFGYLTARDAYVKAPPSWTAGDYGRFDVGARAAGEHAFRGTALAQLGAEWTPSRWLTAHAQLLARAEPSGTRGKRVGFVEAYAELHGERWRLRAGEFFLPTSRENTDPLWTSPYTITYSAINTWAAQEVRPIGVDAQFSPNFYATAGATAFRGNDTMGTLLAARGWAFGSRLTVYDENVAVPPPQDSTKPIGPDLDGKWGFAERLRLQLPERALLQWTHLDNRSELVPRRGQTPWLTRFDDAGAQVGLTGPWTIAAEWMYGETTVGFPGGTFTLDFRSTYLLGSYKREHDRISARVERFSTRPNERGQAWTVAWFREPNDHARAGIEYTRASGEHLGAGGIGTSPQTGGSMITAELRYKF